MTPAEVREQLIAALQLDLVGPEPDSAHARELLPLQPSRWYLTGFLVPYKGADDDRSDFAGQDELDLAGDDDAAGDDAAVRGLAEPHHADREVVDLLLSASRRLPVGRKTAGFLTENTAPNGARMEP
jgi:hypothetical protein